MRPDHYDGFAGRYAAENESSLFNAYYERPAMLELAGDVRGRRILDAGCGAGPLSEALAARGAVVTGFDASPARWRFPDADYFAVASWSEEYDFDGQRATLTYWHRPLQAMTTAFTDAGFRLSVLSEPPFSPDTPRELLPPELDGRTAFLCFIFFVLEAR
ncbi:methyltransferase domain-containing protein [Micromonospora echinospora]